MNRLVIASCIGALAASSFGCAVSGVGDPCTPEFEFLPRFSALNTDLTIDVSSVQCETRVCLSHYFQGRVSCPFGNDGTNTQTGKCQAVAGKRGLYTLDGTATGTFCCPVLGDPDEKPMPLVVKPQCAERPAEDAVYCSCRCDVPDDPEIDRSKVTLCACPDGFECKPLCTQTLGGCGTRPKGKWGSYCVKAGPKGSAYNSGNPEAFCTSDLRPSP